MMFMEPDKRGKVLNELLDDAGDLEEIPGKRVLLRAVDLIIAARDRLENLEQQMAAMSQELALWNKQAGLPGGASARIAENERLREAVDSIKLNADKFSLVYVNGFWDAIDAIRNAMKPLL
jgi:hypothetical protein